MSKSRAAEQRERYWGLKNGTWNVEERRAARLADACGNGHAYVEGSWKWKTSKGSRFRSCKLCTAEQESRRHAERMATEPMYRVRSSMQNHNNRAKAAGDSNRLTIEDMLWVWDTYGKACLACGSMEQPEIDHVHAQVKGGLNVRENLQPLCRPCNVHKRARTVDYRPATHSAPSQSR